MYWWEKTQTKYHNWMNALITLIKPSLPLFLTPILVSGDSNYMKWIAKQTVSTMHNAFHWYIYRSIRLEKCPRHLPAYNGRQTLSRKKAVRFSMVERFINLLQVLRVQISQFYKILNFLTKPSVILRLQKCKFCIVATDDYFDNIGDAIRRLQIALRPADAVSGIQ